MAPTAGIGSVRAEERSGRLHQEHAEATGACRGSGIMRVTVTAAVLQQRHEAGLGGASDAVRSSLLRRLEIVIGGVDLPRRLLPLGLGHCADEKLDGLEDALLCRGV